jgi:hypothetical protein
MNTSFNAKVITITNNALFGKAVSWFEESAPWGESRHRGYSRDVPRVNGGHAAKGGFGLPTLRVRYEAAYFAGSSTET